MMSRVYQNDGCRYVSCDRRIEQRNGRPDILNLMVNDGEVLVSTATAVEIVVVAMGKSDAIYDDAVEFLARWFIRLVPLDEEQLWIATEAHLKYGTGREHPAQLNFGDTFAYALAASRGLPLLYKGGDFSRTDIPAAV